MEKSSIDPQYLFIFSLFQSIINFKNSSRNNSIEIPIKQYFRKNEQYEESELDDVTQNESEVLFDKKEIPTICCGEPMMELVANTEEAAFEKHVPVIEEKENEVIVKVGEVAHPMLPEHFIEFIVLHTDQGYKLKHLKPGDAPVASFAILDNEIVFSAYAYCNLHGMWDSK